MPEAAAAPEKRKTAIRSAINLAIAEGMLIFAVLLVWMTTGNVVILIGGLIGAQLIFVPMFIRWAKEHAAALKADR